MTSLPATANSTSLLYPQLEAIAAVLGVHTYEHADHSREATGKRQHHLGLMYEVNRSGEQEENTRRFQMSTALVQSIRIGDDTLDEAVARYAAAKPGRPAIDPKKLDFDGVQRLIDEGFYKPDARFARLLNKGSALYNETRDALQQARQAEAAHNPAAADEAMRTVDRLHAEGWQLLKTFSEQQSSSLHFTDDVLSATHATLDTGSKVVLAAALPVVAGVLMPQLIATAGWVGAVQGAGIVTGMGTAMSVGEQIVEAAAGVKTDPRTALDRTLGAAGQSLQIAIGAGVSAGAVTVLAKAASAQFPALARTATWALEHFAGQGISGMATGAAAEVIDHGVAKVLHREGEPAPELSGKAVLVNALGTAFGNITGARIGITQFKARFGASAEQMRHAANFASSGVAGLVQNAALGRSGMDNLTMLATTLGSQFASSRHHERARIPRMLEHAHKAQAELRTVLDKHARDADSDQVSAHADSEIGEALAPVIHRIGDLEKAGAIKPAQAAAKELYEQFAADGGVQERMKAYGTGRHRVMAKTVAGVSDRMAAVLVDLASHPCASIDPTGAANAEHLATVFDGALLTAREKARRPLTQKEVDWIALQTVLTDIFGKGRTPTELAEQLVAPVINLENGDAVGETGGAIAQHMVRSNPAYANASGMVGTLLHGIPAFELVRAAVAKAGYKHEDAQRMYAGVLGHHMTGFIANGFAKAKMMVDFDKLAEPDPKTNRSPLTPADAAKLKTLYTEAIGLYGKWRGDIEAYCRDNGALPPGKRVEFAEAAAKLKAAIEDLPEHIQSQLINDDVQQFTPVGIAKWLATGMRFAPEGATMADVLHWNYRGAVQAYYEQALALGYGDQFKDRTETSAIRLGMIFDPGNEERGGHFRPVQTSDGDAYAAFARHLQANKQASKAFDQQTSPHLDIVDWFRGSTANKELLHQLATTPMSR